MTVEDLTEYEQGYVCGLWAYAWWKDGVAHVGTTGTTFRQALRGKLAEWGYDADQIEAVVRSWGGPQT